MFQCRPGAAGYCRRTFSQNRGAASDYRWNSGKILPPRSRIARPGTDTQGLEGHFLGVSVPGKVGHSAAGAEVRPLAGNSSFPKDLL